MLFFEPAAGSGETAELRELLVGLLWVLVFPRAAGGRGAGEDNFVDSSGVFVDRRAGGAPPTAAAVPPSAPQLPIAGRRALGPLVDSPAEAHTGAAGDLERVTAAFGAAAAVVGLTGLLVDSFFDRSADDEGGCWSELVFAPAASVAFFEESFLRSFCIIVFAVDD